MVILSLSKSFAVVIKVMDYKENDKLVWLYTEKHGKITCIVRGAKKSKSKFLSLTLPLCFGEYVFFKGKNMYNIQEGKIINSFQSLLENLDKLTYSTYLCELIDIAVEEHEVNETLFKDLVTCLYLLSTDALDYEILVRSFELRILNATGYGLNLTQCSLCKEKMTTSNYISLSNFGGVCEKCVKQHGIYVSRGAYNALRFIISTPMDKLYRLNVSKDIKDEIAKVTTTIISNNYSRRPKSLDMLNYIKE